MSQDKPRLAWISALEVENCISSYISALLLPYVERHFDVTRISDEVSARSFHSSAFDISFINIENFPEALFAMGLLDKCRTPSLMYVHDVYFNGQQLKSKDFAYHEAVFFSSRLDMQRCRAEIGTLASYFPYPVNIEIPPVREAKLSTDSPLKILLFASTGTEFRPEKLIRAIASQTRHCEVHWMLDDAEQSFIAPLCSRLGLSDVNFLKPRDFSLWSQACRDSDLVFLPKVSALSDLGPVLPLALASNSRVVVTDFADTGELPEGVVIKVPIGYREEEVFADIIAKRIVNPGVLSSRALEYVREVHEVGFLASELLGSLKRALKNNTLIESPV